MASQLFVTAVGTKQGAFKGESTQQGREGKIPGVTFSYGILSPRDPVTGAAVGKHLHQALIFTKEWGVASPQFYQAAFTSEVLATVLFEFFAINREGLLALDHTIKLTNASVTAVRQVLQNNQPVSSPGDPREFQEISLNFQKIEIVNLIGGTQASDDLQGNR